MCTCLCACMCECVCTCVPVCLCVHVCMCVCAHVHHLCVCVTCIHVSVHVCACLCVCTHTRVSLCACPHARVSLHVAVCVHACACVAHPCAPGVAVEAARGAVSIGLACGEHSARGTRASRGGRKPVWRRGRGRSAGRGQHSHGPRGESTAHSQPASFERIFLFLIFIKGDISPTDTVS